MPSWKKRIALTADEDVVLALQLLAEERGQPPTTVALFVVLAELERTGLLARAQEMLARGERAVPSLRAHADASAPAVNDASELSSARAATARRR
jgi:hypothetical protein